MGVQKGVCVIDIGILDRGGGGDESEDGGGEGGVVRVVGGGYGFGIEVRALGEELDVFLRLFPFARRLYRRLG